MAEKRDSKASQRREAAKKAAETRRKNAQAAQEEAQESQEQASQAQAQASEELSKDSELQTPQPDEPMPKESERQQDGDTASDPDPRRQEDEVADDPEPRRQEGESADEPNQTEPDKADQQPSQRVNMRADVRLSQDELINQHVDREFELQEERRRHNERTGGGPIEEGEILKAQAKHFYRTDSDALETYRQQFEEVGAEAKV